MGDDILACIRNIIETKPLSYFNYIMSNKHSNLRDYVLKHSSFLDDKINPKTNKPYNKATRIIYAINDLKSFPICSTCGKDILRDLSLTDDLTKLHCCNRCAQKDINIISKIKDTKLKNHGDCNFNNIEKSKTTCKERYGVEYYYQSNDFRTKAKNTTMQRYGVEHHMKSNEVKASMKARYKELHGVEYSFADENVKKKLNSRFQEKYGVDWPMQNPELHKIMHENSSISQTTKFYNSVISNDEYVEPLFSLDEWLNRDRSNYMQQFKWKCKKCGKVFNSHIMRANKFIARCYDCYPVETNTSMFEKEIASFISGLGSFEVVNHTIENRNIISHGEIDIVVKKNGNISLLIEADGLYWHSSNNGKDKTYHITKTNKCEQLGFQLLHIFDDEWNNKRHIVESRIKDILGVFDHKIFARKCIVKEISSSESKNFLNENHLQGNCNSKVKLGLFYEDDLVSVMTFGAKRKIMNSKSIDETDYEMLRYASKCGYHVVGGASKLLKYFERTYHPSSILSYADRRWSHGKLYKALGFELHHIAKPNYWYVNTDHSKRLYRYGFRKSIQHKLLPIFDNSKSESENMLANGYDVVWDCGNFVFLKTYDIYI